MKHNFFTRALVLFALSFSPLLKSQSFTWAKQLGGAGSVANGIKVVNDPQGNVYSMGTFSGTVDFDPGPGTYTLNQPAPAMATTSSTMAGTFILKLDSSGNFVWAKAINSCTGTDMILDRDQNPIIVGKYMSVIDVDPDTAATYTLAPGTGFYSYFVLKLNAVANFVWAKPFKSFGYGFCEGRSVMLDSLQNIYVSGLMQNMCDFDPDPVNTYTLNPGYGNAQSFGEYPVFAFFLSKLDSGGNFVFAKETAGGQLIKNKNGQLLIACNGEYTNTSAQAHLFSGQFSLSKYDLLGNQISVRWLCPNCGGSNSTSMLYVSSIATDKAGNVYAYGYFHGTIDFDPGQNIFEMTSTQNSLFILKLDSALNFAQAQQIAIQPGSSALPAKIITDAAGNIYMGGTFKGIVDFAPNISQTVTLSTSNNSGFILKLDAFGEFGWVRQVGQDAAMMIDLALDDFGSFYSTGSFTNTANFDPAGSYSLTSFGNYDAFVQKLSGPLVTGIFEQQALSSTVSLFPNPSNGAVYINTAVPLQKGTCRIMGVDGKMVQEQRNINGNAFSIDVSTQAQGVYIIEISDAQNLARVKLIRD